MVPRARHAPGNTHSETSLKLLSPICTCVINASATATATVGSQLGIGCDGRAHRPVAPESLAFRVPVRPRRSGSPHPGLVPITHSKWTPRPAVAATAVQCIDAVPTGPTQESHHSVVHRIPVRRHVQPPNSL